MGVQVRSRSHVTDPNGALYRSGLVLFDGLDGVRLPKMVNFSTWFQDCPYSVVFSPKHGILYLEKLP